MAAAESDDYSSDFLNKWSTNPSSYKLLRQPDDSISAETRLTYLRQSEHEYRSYFSDGELPTLEIAIFRNPIDRFISAVNSIHNRIASWEEYYTTTPNISEREKAHATNAAKKMLDVFTVDRMCEFKQFEFDEYKHIKPYDVGDESDYESVIDVLLFFYQSFALDMQTDWINVHDNMDIFTTEQINEKVKPVLESLSNKILPECVSHETLYKGCSELSPLQTNSVCDYYQDDIKVYESIE